MYFQPLNYFAFAFFMAFFSGILFMIPQYNEVHFFSFRLVPFIVVGFLCATLSAWWGWKMLAWWIGLAATCLTGGLLLVGIWETGQVLDAGHWGITNLFEVTKLLVVVTGLLGAYYDAKYVNGSLGSVLWPFLFAAALFLWWLAGIDQGYPQSLVPALQNNILPFHVIANFLAYGAFMIAAFASVLILFNVQPDKAQHIAYQSVKWGFISFTIAILLGCYWAYQAWGGYWSWDPKETWSLIVWLVYAGYLHCALAGYSQRVLAYWALIGFFATLFCYLGVNIFLSGMHSYGSLS